MVVVYGIARTTVMRSVTEAVFSSSCMNHVGIVHLKEGEKGEKAIHLKKNPTNNQTILNADLFLCYHFFPFLCFFVFFWGFFCSHANPDMALICQVLVNFNYSEEKAAMLQKTYLLLF